MQRIGVVGILVERAQISGYGIVQLVLSEVLHALVIKIFFIIHGTVRRFSEWRRMVWNFSRSVPDGTAGARFFLASPD